ncbi:MAG: DUF4260 domain-containing protein [Actinomycetota bacterium]
MSTHSASPIPERRNHPSATTPALSTDGIVTGSVHTWLRLEGLTLLVAAMWGFAYTGSSWWLFATLLLAPDLGALGYLHSRRAGTHLYNLAHTTAIPAGLAALGLAAHHTMVLAIGLIWLAHIGMDRTMNYGLKYTDDFGHTHLGWHGSASH